MAIVEDPHIGLTKGEWPSHLVAMTVAAASASSIGAFPGIVRYPCLANVSPEVSIKISALLSRQNKWITARSNAGPELGLSPVLARMRSATASLTFTFINIELFTVG